ncbi:multidrug ABC transporter ATP-binding protein [Paenibacillus sambharensis]|uniref:Multidrug ABC transporter ATP-binding protein n=1 Tax=Paenibacillus sambharensis TaxID=1803190 RepID=A0A2W1LUG2_9BACL|nr:ATP-binding cassette domain-containing protein [Paenibacillus sambharensis]PZD95421.1 multidrug ABC transporter ATP-binding protein [Paenibacillus sambharensis]
MERYAVKIDRLSKKFRGRIIFDNVSFALPTGQIYGFIGPNGSGKSVLFKVLCGFLTPDQGEVEILGDKIGKKVDFPQDTGIIIEQPGFLDQYTGMRNLALLASLRRRVGVKEIRETLVTVGLDPDNNQPVKKYSLGMKQRLAIAQAIMENPRVLILDEPFNGLDRDGVELIRSLLVREKNKGKTILLTSHIQEDISLLCDEVFEFANGTIYNIENRTSI